MFAGSVKKTDAVWSVNHGPTGRNTNRVVKTVPVPRNLKGEKWIFPWLYHAAASFILSCMQLLPFQRFIWGVKAISAVAPARMGDKCP